MIKLFFGSFVAAVAMFLTGFLYFAGPIATAGYTSASETQGASVQSALAANLPATGTYLVPDPSTQSGTTLYGKGPVATVHYNSRGFAADSTEGLLPGFILYLVVAFFMAGALSQLDRRVPDFKSRALIVICFAFASSTLIVLGDPIWLHTDWRHAIYNFIGDVLMLSIAGLILARWFMPTKAELAQAPKPEPLPVQKLEEASSAPEIAVVDRPGL
jgi:hypothetical protein